MARQVLDFYSRTDAITSAGKYSGALQQLPDDLESLVRIVQGLIVHEFVTSSFYGVEVSGQRRNESHIRPVEQMIERIFALDGRPLTVPRPPESRLMGVCRHFLVLLLAMLRARASLHAGDVASEPISIQASSRITWSASTGMLRKDAGR